MIVFSTDIYVKTNMFCVKLCNMAQRKKRLALQRIFRALSDPTRLRLLNLVNGREVCVCYLTEILRLSQPKISRHLAYLRRSGMVTARRQGKWMHYRLVFPKERIVAEILKSTLDLISRDSQMQYDLAHLDRACCSPEEYDVPRDAPPPEVWAKVGTTPRFPSPNEQTSTGSRDDGKEAPAPES